MKQAAIGIGALIDEFVTRGVFRAAALPKVGAGKETFRIVWFRDQAMLLEADAKRGRVSLSDFLPPVAPRSKFYRELRAWISSRGSADLPAHRRFDPSLMLVALRSTAGQMQLHITSTTGDLALATRKLVQLVNELYLDFLAAPERYDWILDAFELDPDNPHWP